MKYESLFIVSNIYPDHISGAYGLSALIRNVGNNVASDYGFEILQDSSIDTNKKQKLLNEMYQKINDYNLIANISSELKDEDKIVITIIVPENNIIDLRNLYDLKIFLIKTVTDNIAQNNKTFQNGNPKVYSGIQAINRENELMLKSLIRNLKMVL